MQNMSTGTINLLKSNGKGPLILVLLHLLIDCCFPLPVQFKCTRLVFSSSATVYGMTENVPIKETDALCAYNFHCAFLSVVAVVAVVVMRHFYMTFLEIFFLTRVCVCVCVAAVTNPYGQERS